MGRAKSALVFKTLKEAVNGKKIVAVCACLILLFTLDMVPVVAQGPEQKDLSEPFSTCSKNGAGNIPIGATIYHLSDGVTKVFAPDGALFASVRESDLKTVGVPGGSGKTTVSRVHDIPTGSYIETHGNVTKVYSDDTCILTIINSSNTNKSAQINPPVTSGWIEYVADTDVDNLNTFRAKWHCPSYPPNCVNAYGYIFNGIEPADFSDIIQPCIEWNYGQSGRWTGAAWRGIDGDYYRDVNAILVNPGDEIWGTLQRNFNMWYIYLQNYTTYQTSYITCYNTPGSSDLVLFCALEGWDIGSNNDVPGDTGFYDMGFWDSSSNTIDIQWNSVVDPDGKFQGVLSGLSISRDLTQVNDTYATLNTAN